MQKQYIADSLCLTCQTERGEITSLTLGGEERLLLSRPLFCLRLRHRDGATVMLIATDARSIREKEERLVFADFGGAMSALSVSIGIAADDALHFHIRVDGVPGEYAVEWVDLPILHLPKH